MRFFGLGRHGKTHTHNLTTGLTCSYDQISLKIKVWKVFDNWSSRIKGQRNIDLRQRTTPHLYLWYQSTSQSAAIEKKYGCHVDHLKDNWNLLNWRFLTDTPSRILLIGRISAYQFLLSSRKVMHIYRDLKCKKPYIFMTFIYTVYLRTGVLEKTNMT